MSDIGPPKFPDLPIFVYGLMKPGELGHSQIRGFVRSSRPATVKGILRLREGIPLFDSALEGEVTSCIVEFALQGMGCRPGLRASIAIQMGGCSGVRCWRNGPSQHPRRKEA